MKKYWKLITGIVLISVALLFLPVQSVFHSYTSKLLHELLTDMVEDQSKGEYTFHFKKLRYNIFSQKITLEEFHFSPKDSSTHLFDSNAVKNNLYCEIAIKKIEIQIDDQFDFFFYKMLEIKDVKVDFPRANITNNKIKNEEVSISKMTGDLYQIITEYFAVFELKNVSVNNVVIDYTLNTKDFNHQYSFNPFSFNIVDFKMDREDGKLSKKKILFTENLELNSGYQEFTLSDSLHKISYDRFSISMKKEFVEFHNLRIAPISDTIRNDINSINLFVPTVKIIDIDFSKAYYDEQISIRKLLIERPAMNLQLVGAKSENDTISISEKLSNSKIFEALASIDIERLILTHSSASVSLFQKGRKLDFLINGLNYKVSKLRVDNTSFNNFVFADLHKNYKFSVTEIKHEVVDEGLMAAVKNVSYSSLTRVLDVEQLKVLPNLKNIQKNVRLHKRKLQFEKLESKGIHLSNFNLDEVVDNKSLSLASIRIEEPTIKLLYDTAFVKDTANIPTGMSNLLSSFLDTLTTQNFKINNAVVTICDAHNPTQKFANFKSVDVYTGRFNANSFSNEKYSLYDLLESSAISTSSSYIDVPGLSDRVSWVAMNYSAASQKIRFNQLNYSGSFKKAEVKSYFKSIAVSGLSPRRIFKNGDRHLGLVELSDGSIDLIESEKSANKQKRTSSFSVDSLSLNQVDIMHSIKDTVMQRVENLSIHAGALNYSKDSLGKLILGLRASNIAGENGLFAVDNNRHLVEFKRFSFSSSDSTLIANSIDVKPIIDQRNSNSNTLVRSNIDYVDITGAFLNEENVLSEIRGDQLNICSPVFRMNTMTKDARRTPNSRRSFLEMHQWFAEVTGIKLIEYKELNIENGLADIVIQNSSDLSKVWHLSIPQYNLSGRNFKLDSIQKNHDNHLFYANSYLIDAYQIVQQFPDSLQDFKMKHLTYNSGKKYLKVNNLDIRYMIYRKSDSVKKMFVEGTIPLIELEGIKPIELNEKKILNLRRAHLKNPEIQITQFHKNTEFVSREMEFEKENQDKDAIKKLVLKELALVDGNISWDFEDTSKQSFNFKHVSLNGSDVKFNPNTKDEIPKFGEVELSFGDFKHEVMKKFYDLQLDSFYLNSRSEEMKIEGGQLIPRYGIFEFAKVAGWEKSRLELYISKINFEKFKVKELIYNNSFQTSLITADSLWLRNFKNKNYPMISRFMVLPTQSLRKSSVKINIDSVRLNNAFIEHRQLAKNGVKSGKLLLTELQATANNITNDSSVLAENRIAEIHASTKLMGEALISADFDFDLIDSLGGFIGDAKIEPFDASLLNDYIEPTAYVRIRKGMVKGGDVHFYANDILGSGEMKLLYKNLHVDFLNPKDPLNQKNRGQLMKTFLANRIVNTQNPHFFITKKGDVFYRRDTSRSIFHYWGNLAMSGVASSAGVSSNKKEVKHLKKEIKRLNKEALRKEKAIRRKEDEEAEEGDEGKDS